MMTSSVGRRHDLVLRCLPCVLLATIHTMPCHDFSTPDRLPIANLDELKGSHLKVSQVEIEVFPHIPRGVVNAEDLAEGGTARLGGAAKDHTARDEVSVAGPVSCCFSQYLK